MGKKTGKIVVPTEPTNPPAKITGFAFKSYDKNAGILQFQVKNQDGSPTDLIDATVRLFMYLYQGEEKKEFPIFDNQIITESYMQGIVKYPIPDMLLGYEGKVDANIYIDFPDGSHTDNLAFTFNIIKSVIDGDVQLNGEYYFKDFQQLLDGVKQEATDAVNAALATVDSTIEKANQQISDFVEGATQAIDKTVDEVNEQLQATQTKIDTVSQDVTSAQNNLTTLENRIDQTNQQIGDLGKLKKMYANSIDFGDYDYSGNPNLLPKLTANDFRFTNTAVTGYTKTDNGTSMKVTKAADAPSVGLITGSVTRLKSNETYTLSVDAKALTDIVAGGLTFTLRWKDSADVTRTADAFEGQSITTTETKFSKTFTTGAVSDGTAPSLQLYFNGDLVGENEVDLHYDIKLEKGSTATPYQPNLLDAPYYLSEKKLGFNLLEIQVFPVITTDYMCLNRTIVENYQAGEEYVITLKGTKPATQSFTPRIDNGSPSVSFSSLRPVEGLTDVWTTTIQVTQEHINSGVTNGISIFQYPPSTKGTVQIDWLKIEKGDTRTPNISQFKYFGESLKDSSDPTDYSWDITPEYAEKGLNNTVSLTEPQSVEGLKNFEDGLQIAGKEVATVPEDTGWVNLTAINGHSWNKQGQIRRIGKLVMFRGSLKGSTLSTQDFCTIPEGFRPSNPTDNYEYQFLLPPQSSNTLDNGGMAYIRPNGVCGLPSFRGTVNLFLAPIQYYID
jgi:hypothetical protein